MASIRGSNVESEQYSAGVDWGGSFHQLCVVDNAGNTVVQKRYHHTGEGLEALSAKLKGLPG